MLKKICFILKVVVLFNILISLISFKWTATFICLFNLILLFIADYVMKKINYSNFLQLLIYVFLVSSLVGGEVYNLYSIIWFYDIILHILSSFIISFLFFNIFKGNVNKFLSMLCIFSFAMMVAGLWEITEFSIDRLLDKDMQKDTVISEINSMLLSSDGNTVINVKVSDMSIGGTIIDGYLDVGLYDTIEDMICALFGSVFYLIIDRRRIKEASLI